MQAILSYICLYLCSFSFIFADTPFTLMTIPKSGSHIAMKALHFLSGGVPIWHTRFPSLEYISPSEAFLYTHLCLSPELEEAYIALPKLKKILMIRDLRDVCVSMVDQIHKGPWPGLSGDERDAFLALSFDEQLLFVIQYEYDVHKVAATAPNSLQVSLVRIAEQAARFYNEPKVYVCKYENLVGVEGGGSFEAQIDELKKISKFLDLPCTDDRLQEIASKLYGNEADPFGQKGFKNFVSTFSNGKIGRWQSHFKEVHKEAFKKKVGKQLIQLGYEKDNHW